MMRFAGILFLAVLAGCGAKHTAEPPRPLESFTPSMKLDRAWSLNLAGPDRVRVGLAPALDGQNVVAAGRDGRVVAVTLERGQRVWQQDTRAPLSGGPGVGDGLVVVGSSDGDVIALDAADGSIRWRVQVGGEVLAAPAISRGIVVVRTGDGRLVGLDAGDGGRIWSYEQPVPSLSLRGNSGPVVSGDVVLTGFDNGRLVANQVRDGALVWDTPVGIPSGRTEVERMVDINASPRIIGRDVYVVSYQGRLAALSLESGRILWSHEMSSTAGLGAAALGVWVTDANSEVVGFDRLSGNQLWRQDALRARALTAPAPVGDAVAVGDYDGYVHLLSQESGALLARARAGNAAIRMPPLVVGDLVIVQTAGGAVVAYRVAD